MPVAEACVPPAVLALIDRARIGLTAACLTLAVAGASTAGEVRCWIDDGAVVVPAAYGPIAGDFILDLSQARSQLHATAAQTAGWTSDTARWPLRFAGETRRDFPMTVADLDSRIADFPTNIAGVLGADAFGRFTLDLDLRPCRLLLSRGLPQRLPGLHRLQTAVIADAPAVSAAISDGLTTRTGWFAIDTASASSRIADAGFSRPLPTGVDASGRTRGPARLRAMSVGGALFEQTPAGLMRPVTPGLAGALGTAVWARFHLRIEGRRVGAWRVQVGP